MLTGTIPFDRYPGLPPLFLDFLRGLPEFYPDPPTLEAAAARARRQLGRPARIPPEAFRVRVPPAREMARELAAGRAVAILAGHQIGLFTGPLFTITKTFDAIRVARDLRGRGIPAVPVFWALTDDHDLDEIARTAKPGKTEPEVLVLEGADRANRRPVGSLPLPEESRGILEAFRDDARTEENGKILDVFARRYQPGTSYGEAFIETLFDLVGDEPLLVLDPSSEALRREAAEFFLLASGQSEKVREAWRSVAERLESAGKAVPVPFRHDVFPFFVVEKGERRRVVDPSTAAKMASTGSGWISTDVLTRPVFKSFLLPVAASVLGAAEIAYHAQSLALYPLFDLAPPVLFPRSHLVLLGPPERRAAEALGIAAGDLLQPPPSAALPSIPEIERLAALAAEVERSLSALEPGLEAYDATLVGALENARKKVSYQLEQLRERVRKSAERRDETAANRRKRLQTMLLPLGTPAERLYPPLVPLLAYGWPALVAIRQAATGSLAGAEIVAMGADRPAEPAEKESAHVG